MNTLKFPFKHLVKHHKCGTPIEYILEILPRCNSTGPWIGGGALLRTYIGKPLDTDIDVFFQNKEQFDKYVSDLLYGGNYDPNENTHKFNSNCKYTAKIINNTSDWHTTIEINYMNQNWLIQCVSFIYFKDIGELFDSFDFNICMLAYDGSDILISETTFKSIEDKKMKLMKVNYPSVTLKRLVKYMRMGYDIDDCDVKTLSDSFKVIKEPKGNLDNKFGISTSDKKYSKINYDYSALRT